MPELTPRFGGQTRLNAVLDGRQPVAVESALETVVNMVLRLPPMAVKAPIAATDTKAAIRPYSMAVAPSSSPINAIIFAIEVVVQTVTHHLGKNLIVD